MNSYDSHLFYKLGPNLPSSQQTKNPATMRGLMPLIG